MTAAMITTITMRKGMQMGEYARTGKEHIFI